jgi:hypothetical protein
MHCKLVKYRAGYIMALTALLGCWFYLAYTNLYYFSIPWMDTWAHMGPAVKTYPLNLRMPLVGDFLGGDHTWAIQWPGSETIASLILYILPATPSSQVIYMILLWLILAWVTGSIVYRCTNNYYIAVLAALLILFDRNYFAIAHAQRPEFAATLVLLWLMVTLYRLLTDSATSKLFIQFYICCFSLVLLHPITLPLAILSLLLSIYFALTGKWPLKTIYFSAVFLLLGICLLAFSFTHSLNAWLQFSDHLNQNIDKIHFPITLWNSINQFYFPFYTGGVIIFVGVAGSIYNIINGLSSKNINFDCVLSLYIIASALLVGYHYNTFYAIFVFTLSLLVVSLMLAKYWPNSLVFRNVIIIAVILFTGIHGLFWITRELKFLQTGKPNLRHELLDIFNTLPSSRRIYLPESLWETAIYSNKSDRCLMNTLPYVVSNNRRQLYEDYAYRDVKDGDILIVDQFSSNKGYFLDKLNYSGWCHIYNVNHFLPGRSPWGYDLHIYIMWKNDPSKVP